MESSLAGAWWWFWGREIVMSISVALWEVEFEILRDDDLYVIVGFCCLFVVTKDESLLQLKIGLRIGLKIVRAEEEEEEEEEEDFNNSIE
jgi:hypothetical protein